MNNFSKLKDGVHEGIPFDEYLKWPAVSKSGLMNIYDSPGMYQFRLKHPKPRTKNMMIGSAIDTLFFDGPDEFYRQFAVKPQGMKLSTKEGKAWAAEHATRDILSWEETAAVTGAVEAIEGYAPAREYIDDGVAQLSMMWHDPETGVRMKARPDFKPDDRPVIVDLKSTEDARLEMFARIARRFKYHWQAAIYSDGWEVLTGETIEEFVFVVVEPGQPHRVEVHELELSNLTRGREEYREHLELYAICQEKNRWPLGTGVKQMLDIYTWQGGYEHERC